MIVFRQFNGSEEQAEALERALVKVVEAAEQCVFSPESDGNQFMLDAIRELERALKECGCE